MENETDTERIFMDRETLSEMCEDSWGVGLDRILQEMDDEMLLNQPMFVKDGELNTEERVVQFFVEMVNRI